MQRWSASDFLKDFDDFDNEESYIDDTKESKNEGFNEGEKVNKFDNFNEGHEVETRAIPTFEIMYSEESGFGVYSCKDENNKEFSIKGSFPRPLMIGKTYLFSGKLESYKSRMGEEKQLVVEKVESVMPIGKDGIIEYLQTLKGLKKRAHLIYDEYGDRSLEVLKENPLEVANMITGIGKKSVLNWQKELMEIEDSEAELIYLMDIGLKPHQANILYKKYEERVVEKIKENPYILSKELERFGFLRTDEIARNMGYELDSPHRVQEGVIYALNTATNDGHCYLPEKELISNASELLSIKLTIHEMNKFAKKHISNFNYDLDGKTIRVDYNEMISLLNQHNLSKWKNESLRHEIFQVKKEDIEHQIKMLSLEGRVVISNGKVYLEHFHQAEMEVSQHVDRIINLEKAISWRIEEKLEEYCERNKIELEDKQKEAVIRFSQSTGGMHILNGSAGCGKTFTLKIIIAMLDLMYRELGERPSTLLLAPTGKASKVASKATEMGAMTIHRGLEYNPVQGFNRNINNPLDADIIIVDETSMLDIVLAKYLFSAVKYGAKIILLGDTKQLPSVGPGNVLSDLIDSNKVDTVTLTVPKRQEVLSGIITNANNIIEGNMIENQVTEDAFQTIVSSVPQARNELLSLFSRINKFKGYKFDEIQLLCPQRVGPIGTDYMNYLIQKEFNETESPARVLNKSINLDNGERTNLFFREGDKVIHIKNNYDVYWYKKIGEGYTLMGEEFVGITNGESGIIEEIIEEKDGGKTNTKVVVKYDDMFIIYEDGMDEVDHAYALTIHRYQGSQSPAVIMPIMMANYIMLDNNLLYTAYTRAESFITIVGEKRAISHAIKTHKSKHRYTTLQEFL